MDYINNLYISVRDRIFTLLKTQRIPQKDFAQTIEAAPHTITDWKTGRSFSFMKKLSSIAAALDTSEVWLLTGKSTAQSPDIIQEIQSIADSANIHLLDLLGAREQLDRGELKEEAACVNVKFEMDPSLLDTAVEVMRDAMERCRAEACVLAALDSPEARELAQERLRMAKDAERLLFFFAAK